MLKLLENCYFSETIGILKFLKTTYNTNPTILRELEEYSIDSDEWPDLFYKTVGNAAEFSYNDYIEDFDTEKWFFSSENMTECYRISKEICKLSGISRKNNQFARNTRIYLERDLDFYIDDTYIKLDTYTHHKYASSIILYLYDNCCCYLELAAWLVKVFKYFDEQVVLLRQELEKITRRAA